MSTAVPIIRAEGEGERRWFSGGGLHTWKATAEETDGAFLAFEDLMSEGKMTPLHCHPDADETLYVLEGEILVRIGDEERRIGRGSMTVSPRGVPHAFVVTSTVAKLLCLQTPGGGQAFYRNASEPTADAAGDAGVVDLARIQASAVSNGGVQILGPPPFALPLHDD